MPVHRRLARPHPSGMDDGQRPCWRVRRRIQTKDEILDKARDVLAERGPGSLSLREVARRTGFSPAAIYRYFEDRDDLLRALADDAMTSLMDRLRAIPAGLPPDERAVELGLAHLDFAQTNPHQAALLVLHDSLPDISSSPAHQELLEMVFGVFTEGARSGTFHLSSDEEIHSAAFGAWALVEGLAGLQHHLSPELSERLRAHHKAVLKNYVNGLKAAPFGS